VLITEDPSAQTFDKFPDLLSQPQLLTSFSVQGLVGSLIYKDHVGDQVMAAYADMSEFGITSSLDWNIVVIAPLDEILRPARSTEKILLLIGTFVVLITIFLTQWQARRITHPLQLAVIQANRISDGDYSQVLNVNDSGEIGLLAKAFNDMSRARKYAYAKLTLQTQEAEKRAAELVIANEEIAVQTERLSAVIDNIVDGIITISERGTIESFNLAARKIFGYSEKEAIGQNVKILMPEYYHSEHDGYLDYHLKTGEKKMIGIGREVFGQRKDGTTFPMELAVNEVTTNTVKHFVGITRDITEQKKTFDNLMIAMNTAVKANQAKSNFLASMSHDLRTPLNAIIGFSDIMKSELFGAMQNEKYIEYSHDIFSSSNYLLNLVNDILDLTELEYGKKILLKEDIDLHRLAIECHRQLNVLILEKNLECTLVFDEDLKPLSADRHAMMQIIMNLAGNAIKFTPEGGSITVSADISEEGYVISVADTGIGIAEKALEIITDPFTRADEDPHHSKVDGVGLGLSIVKALVDLHDGKLEVSSKVGIGTTVNITLPIRR